MWPDNALDMGMVSSASASVTLPQREEAEDLLPGATFFLLRLYRLAPGGDYVLDGHANIPLTQTDYTFVNLEPVSMYAVEIMAGLGRTLTSASRRLTFTTLPDGE